MTEELCLPEWFDDLVAKAVRDNLDSDGAVAQAFPLVKRHAGFKALVDELVRMAIRYRVHALRKAERRVIEKAVVERHAGPPPVRVGESAAVAEASGGAGLNRSIFNMPFCATRLGKLKGRELLPLAEDAEAKGRGYMNEAKFLRWLHKQGVGPEEEVEQALKAIEAEVDRQYNKTISRVFSSKRKRDVA